MSKSKRPASVLKEVLAFNAGRKPKRVRLKLQKMNQDVFSFFRGADHLFAADWPKLKPPDPGPSILICGDLHLENFGVYRTEDGRLLYDVNDFDEAVVAPCSIDLVRCTTSILLASELWKLTPLQATNLALVFLERYHAAVIDDARHSDDKPAVRVNDRGPIWDLLGKTALADQDHLLDEQTTRTKGGKRKLVRSELKHPPVSAERAERLRKAVERYGKGQPKPEVYRVLDVTGRIAGIGSLGARRYLVLIAGEGTPETNRLIDIKEVFPSAISSCAEAEQPDWEGGESARVVEAQRALQAGPAAGLDVIKMGRRQFRMREMIPDENRIRIDRFQKDPVMLLRAVEWAGRLTGELHLRGAKRRATGQRQASLAKWVSGPALDSVLASAARYAQRTSVEYQEFHREMADPMNLPLSLREEAKAVQSRPSKKKPRADR